MHQVRNAKFRAFRLDCSHNWRHRILHPTANFGLDILIYVSNKVRLWDVSIAWPLHQSWYVRMVSAAPPPVQPVPPIQPTPPVWSGPAFDATFAPVFFVSTRFIPSYRRKPKLTLQSQLTNRATGTVADVSNQDNKVRLRRPVRSVGSNLLFPL